MPRKLSQAKLLGILEAAHEDAYTYSNTIHSENKKLWSRYRRERYGDEVSNRSQYVTGDVAGTIDWAMTDLIRLFMSGGIVAGYEPSVSGEQAEIFAKQEEQYANHIFLKDNDGYLILRDYLMNGLVGKRGYIGVWWEDPKPGDSISVTGLTVDAAKAYIEDPDIEIDADTVELRSEMAEGQQVPVIDFTYSRMDYSGCMKVEALDPNDVYVAKGFDVEDESDYIAIEREVNRSDLMKMFPDKAREIKLLKQEEGNNETNRQFERDEPEGGAKTYRKANEPFILIDTYIRIDLDNDGIAELWNIKRVGKTILEQAEIDMQPLNGWSSRPEPNKMFSSSLAESAAPSQRLRTALMRSAVDGVRLTTTPRYFANQNFVDINSLLSLDYGGVVLLNDKAPPNTPISNVVQPLIMPDISGSALQLAEKEEREREFVTGVNRQSQGLDPDSLQDTFGGQALLQNSAAARKELIAREAANGLEKVFEKIGKLLRRHHNFRREYKSKSGWVDVMPQHWISECAIDVDVGIGTGSREAALGRMQIIGDTQKQFVEAGMSSIVGEAELYNTARRQVEALGLQDANEFYKDPANSPPQQEGLDPEVVKAQLEMRLKEQAQQHEMKLEEQKAAHEMQLAEFRAQKEAEMAQLKHNIGVITGANMPASRPGGRIDA